MKQRALWSAVLIAVLGLSGCGSAGGSKSADTGAAGKLVVWDWKSSDANGNTSGNHTANCATFWRGRSLPQAETRDRGFHVVHNRPVVDAADRRSSPRSIWEYELDALKAESCGRTDERARVSRLTVLETG